MILDKSTMLADDLAYNGTPTVLDLQAVRAGKGEPIRLWAQGSSDLATVTGLTIVDGATSSPSDALMTYVCTLAGKIVEFELPSDVARYVKVTLTGSSITAGTWSCGVVVRGGVQTAA